MSQLFAFCWCFITHPEIADSLRACSRLCLKWRVTTYTPYKEPWHCARHQSSIIPMFISTQLYTMLHLLFQMWAAQSCATDFKKRHTLWKRGVDWSEVADSMSSAAMIRDIKTWLNGMLCVVSLWSAEQTSHRHFIKTSGYHVDFWKKIAWVFFKVSSVMSHNWQKRKTWAKNTKRSLDNWLICTGVNISISSNSCPLWGRVL